ncbi:MULTISPECIES: hypothetical protein [Halorussus]|uniref:hypothetical protein n=1 Tax=Halorussus TaxID=1070314 RepID=UPI00209DC5EA|nr:hypothetical protein [Halorussus vallis]USZ78140.1 hypothetical protein NGM07_21005 [Halorussus vallis]
MEVIRVAVSTYLASTLVTGLLLIAVWLFVGRIEDWRRDAADVTAPRTEHPARLTESPAVWTAGFLFLVVAVGGGAVALISGVVSVSASSWVVVAGALGALLVCYLVWGVRGTVRYRGYGNAFATLAAAWTAGLLLVTAVAISLVMGG